MSTRRAVVLAGVVTLIGLGVCACRSKRRPSADAARPERDAGTKASASPGAVRVYGSLREIMHQGKLGAAIDLATLPRSKSRYALGALSGLRGEVTIVEGQAWISYPTPQGKVRTERSSRATEKAALLVHARVPRWQTVVLGGDVPFARLDATIARLAAARGVDIGRPFPFLVAGPVRDLEWHVIDGSKVRGGASSHRAHQKAAVRGIFRETRAALLGFHSARHHGVFTHMGANTHIHTLLEAPLLTAHVDKVTLPAGTRIKLPARGWR